MDASLVERLMEVITAHYIWPIRDVNIALRDAFVGGGEARCIWFRASFSLWIIGDDSEFIWLL